MFGIFFTLKLALSVCVVFWREEGAELVGVLEENMLWRIDSQNHVGFRCQFCDFVNNSKLKNAQMHKNKAIMLKKVTKLF